MFTDNKIVSMKKYLRKKRYEIYDIAHTLPQIDNKPFMDCERKNATAIIWKAVAYVIFFSRYLHEDLILFHKQERNC